MTGDSRNGKLGWTVLQFLVRFLSVSPRPAELRATLTTCLESLNHHPKDKDGLQEYILPKSASSFLYKPIRSWPPKSKMISRGFVVNVKNVVETHTHAHTPNHAVAP